MTSVSEALGNQSQLSAALAAGLNAIDRNQTVTFTEYTRYVLPLDGYIFWVATGTTETVAGSVHYAIDREQREDETLGVNMVTFTAEAQVSAFNSVSPTTLWIGSFEGLQFSFSRQADFYQQADLWHYTGYAVYPALASQLVTNSADLAAMAPIVSNSLPIWLAQTTYGTVYPSFLVPDNVVPPYIVAHIEPDGTSAVQPLPAYPTTLTGESGAIGFFNIGNSAIGESSIAYGTPVSGRSGFFWSGSQQLMHDRVRLTLYGFNNTAALQFLVSLIEYSRNTDAFGFMNSPAIKDEKRTQVEMAVLAQKKIIEIEASYYQSAAEVIAWTLIQQASCATNIVSP